MNTVIINGVKHVGTNIAVRNNVVIIDGKQVDSGMNSILSIKVEGTLARLETDCSVNCDDIAGDVVAGGSVNCDDVGGNVSAGGSVICERVGGNVIGGSIRHG